jgi:simple sugar transport system ATP-binding protein
VLGDNGAGTTTLIKIIAGLHQPSEGTYEVEGSPVSFDSPQEALELGIATVYQDLAVCPLMPVWRNFFFLGNEVQKGLRMDIPFMRKTCKEEMLAMGIDLHDVDQAIGTLSGGERQCVAISRAVYYGAKVLILDELTGLMAGGNELEALSHKLESAGGAAAANVAAMLEEEAEELGTASHDPNAGNPPT